MSLLLLILMSKKIHFQKAGCNQHCLAAAGFPILATSIGGRRTLIESSSCLTPDTSRAAPSSCCRQSCKDEGTSYFRTYPASTFVILFQECISIHIGQAGVQMGNACWLGMNSFFQKQLLQKVWPVRFSS